MVHPIMDQYYDRNPYHRRSTAYVKAKGLAANEKATAKLTPPILGVSPPGIDTTGSPPHLQTKKYLGPTIPVFGINRPLKTQAPENGGKPHAKTPLSQHVEASNNGGSPTTTSPSSSLAPPDLRSVIGPGATRQGNLPVPAQGNIKKKRASLNAVEPAYYQHSAQQETSPISPEPPRTEYGSASKIAQFFPELTPLS